MDGLKKGDTVVIRADGPLDGILAQFIRQSKRTSEVVVELKESRGTWSKGDRVQIKPWEVG